MSDLIDRQAAIERIVSIRPSTPKQSDYSHGVDVGLAMAMVAIKEQPSAQPEIIRCRECKNWETSWKSNWGPNYHYCPMIDQIPTGDFYCADAERRTDG